MVPFILFGTSLVVLVAALALKRRRPPRSPVSAPVSAGEERLTEGRDADGLAGFYAYQMAARRVEPPR